jgi:hypothetical protein
MKVRDRLFGDHYVRAEPPDTFFVQFAGRLRRSELASIGRWLRERSLRCTYVFALCDYRRSSAFAPQIRNALLECTHNSRFRGCASFSASYLSSQLSQVRSWLILSDNPVVFFETELRARRWLRRRREQLLGDAHQLAVDTLFPYSDRDE